MALLFSDGFDAYGTSIGGTIATGVLARRGWVGQTTMRVRDGRIDGFAMSGRFTTLLYQPISGTETTKTVGVAIQLQSTGLGVNDWPIQLRDGTSQQIGIRINNTGHLEVTRGASTILETSTDPLQVKRWYYLEFKTTINNSTGAYDVRLDGTVIMSDTSVDTQETGNTYWDRCYINFDEDTTIYVDDFYVTDTTGSDNTGYLHPMHIQTIFPDADVTKEWTTSSGTDHYALVDDNPVDDDTTYVEDSTVTNRDLFDFPALASTTTTIYAATSVIDQRLTDASSVDMKFVNVSNVTTTTSGTNTISTQTAARYAEIYEQDPDAAAAWTKTTLEAAQFGFEIA